MGDRSGTARRFRRAVTVCAFAAAGILAWLPPQPSPALAQSTPSASPALPQGNDLSFADGAGNVLVALTLRPGQPGPNTLLIYVLPLEGAAAAADVPVTLALNHQNVPLDFCSRSCRTADVSIQGGEHVDVMANSPTGGTASFDLPALPAPEGTAVLQQVQDRMHRLTTFRDDELLGPAATPVHTLYTFQAPDRMEMDISTGSQSVFIGPTRYSRNTAQGTDWQAENIGVSLSVPAFAWDRQNPSDVIVAAHLVGTDIVDGVDTQILAFFEQLGSNYPFWFRLWTDDNGLVRRAEMRGQGHFMDERYTDFDAPLSIRPPS
jgi:hypothetical protein